MTTANDEHREPLWVATIHWSFIAFGVIAPWLLHFTVAWWSAWLAIVVFVVLYDRLFVPEGSICMGIPFVIPLGTTMLLLFVQAIHLVKWCAMRFAGG